MPQHRFASIAVLTFCAVTGCNHDATAPVSNTSGANRVLGIVEVQFVNIGSSNMQTTAAFARDLTLPHNQDGSGDRTIQLDSVLAGSFTYTIGDSVFRYLQATYRVRNAQRSDHAAFDTRRTNLTFIAVGTAQTIAGTPISAFRLANGSSADSQLAHKLIPTGLAHVHNDGSLGSAFADVLQVFSEAEVAAIAAPAVVTNIFPYGFMVRRTGNKNNRDLPPSPAENEFVGTINFAFRIPLQPNSANDPTTISVLMLALDDSDVQLTQSLEEQTLAGRRATRERANSLRTSLVTLLPGGTLPAFNGFRIMCSVRTAGSAGAALAHMTNVTASFVSLTPDPYAADGSGSFIAPTSALQARFTTPVNRAAPQTMRIQGLQSGLSFTSATYTGNGTMTVITPRAAFFPGEEVEFTITNALSCPQTHVGRLRTSTTASSGNFGIATSYAVGRTPVAAALGDLNNDHMLDVIVSNRGTNTLSVLLSNGNGTFQPEQSFGAGSQPGSIALSDINADSNLDVAVTNAGNASVLLGRGDGTLGDRIAIVGVGNAGALNLGDMNGDAIIDMVLANTRGDTQVLLGEGGSDFLFQPWDAPIARDAGLALADLNSDGRLDVVATSERDVAIVRVGEGSGNLGTPREIEVGNEPVAVAIADMDGDGRPDLIVANRRSDDVFVLLGNGDGSFRSALTFATRTRPASVAIGDLNGDRRLDVIVGGADGVGVLLGNGDGSLQTERFSAATDVSAVVLGDVNNDSILDLIAVNESRHTITVRLGRP
jgi:hypothetical protein